MSFFRSPPTRASMLNASLGLLCIVAALATVFWLLTIVVVATEAAGLGLLATLNGLIGTRGSIVNV